MTKILGIPLDASATSYHRIVQPLHYLKQENLDIEFLGERQLKIQYQEADVLYANCLYYQSAYQFYREQVKQGKKLILDFDDDYFNIPVDSPEQAQITNKETGHIYRYSAERRCHWVKAFLRLSNIVVVTSEVLKDLYQEWTNNIEVIPNCVSDDMKRDIPKKSHDKIRILWSGSCSHLPDLEILKEPLTKLYQHLGNRIEIYFQGPIDFKTVFKELPFYSLPEVGFGDYLNLIQSIDADIALLPLLDRKFNYAKSNLKFCQMTLMGSAVIASEIGPYKCIEHQKTGLVCKNKEDWYSSLVKLIEQPQLRIDLIENATRYVEEHHKIEKNINRWKQVITNA